MTDAELLVRAEELAANFTALHERVKAWKADPDRNPPVVLELDPYVEMSTLLRELVVRIAHPRPGNSSLTGT